MNKLFLGIILVFNFASADANGQKGPPSPDALINYDKAYEKYQRELAEVREKNKQITESNRKINQALQDGVAAFNAGNYELAVEKFDEGYKLDPDFWGTAPVLLNNKATALRLRGVEKFNKAITEKQNAALAANRYFLDAVLALMVSQKILENSTLPVDEPGKRVFRNIAYISVKELAESYRMLVLTDETRIYEAVEAIEKYIAIENDEILKQKASENLKELKSKYNINY